MAMANSSSSFRRRQGRAVDSERRQRNHADQPGLSEPHRRAFRRAAAAQQPGMFCGNEDGTLDDQTIAALKAFQQKNGLPVTGQAGRRHQGEIAGAAPMSILDSELASSSAPR